MAARRLLLLEDEKPLGELVTHIASKLGYKVISPESFQEAKHIMESQSIDALIVDLAFDHSSGLRALGYFEAKFNNSKALIISKSVKDEGPKIDWAKALNDWTK